MNFSLLNGVQNFVSLINDNWTLIVILIGFVCTIVNRFKLYMQLTDQEKINAIKSVIKETMLERVTNAEMEYENWIKAGAIKRSQVISEIYAKYPILYKVVDQHKLIEWMDESIEESLKVMRQIFEDNENSEE